MEPAELLSTLSVVPIKQTKTLVKKKSVRKKKKGKPGKTKPDHKKVRGK
jgi:hypothetical protein